MEDIRLFIKNEKVKNETLINVSNPFSFLVNNEDINSRYRDRIWHRNANKKHETTHDGRNKNAKDN